MYMHIHVYVHAYRHTHTLLSCVEQMPIKTPDVLIPPQMVQKCMDRYQVLAHIFTIQKHFAEKSDARASPKRHDIDTRILCMQVLFNVRFIQRCMQSFLCSKPRDHANECA